MKQYFIKYKKLIPVVILTFFSASSVISALLNMEEWGNHFHLTIKQYGAFVVLTINYIAFSSTGLTTNTFC